jgi:transposase-like protein
MRQASKRVPDSAEKTVRDIRRATRRHHSAEEKIRIVLEGLRGEDSIAELCRKEGINQNLYYRWSRSSWRRARNGSPATRRVTPRRRQAQSDWPGTYLGGGGDPNNLANAIHAISMHI